ncbi:glycoside hydrolase family 113 [Lewinella sp. IMCC34191]|uniref:glycoside hydrolase family 113 n=1 Tax=Lewinella sp. IMCC34191 TaxID=2259172 RepID=UPI001300B8E2|nr:hypothetical protein [Lewinella sp. IMCC34191]
MDSELSAERILPATFVRGMTFAHEGYRGHNGYGGELAGLSLDSLKRLNVNAVAIVPYTFMRGMEPIDTLPIPEHYGAENDSAVLVSIRQARARGMQVMLKPQIWIRGSWPGEIDFSGPDAWDRFFLAYQRWIGHYADMAQSEQVEALCIGTELVHATLQYPERWRAIIRELRSRYDGKLTYAANWGEEFENLSFWEDLDIIGLNSYYPLADHTEPDDAELMAGARRWITVADRIGQENDRPVWLTEVGYRSVATAWMNPHAEAGDRASSLDHQARCYAALANAVRASDRVTGMFVWKWPSYLGHQEDRAGREVGFVPGGKPAGLILRELYRQPAQ